MGLLFTLTDVCLCSPHVFIHFSQFTVAASSLQFLRLKGMSLVLQVFAHEPENWTKFKRIVLAESSDQKR